MAQALVFPYSQWSAGDWLPFSCRPLIGSPVEQTRREDSWVLPGRGAQGLLPAAALGLSAQYSGLLMPLFAQQGAGLLAQSPSAPPTPPTAGAAPSPEANAAPASAPAAGAKAAKGSTPNRGAKLFLAGGVAGAVARTCTAPLDRIKLLLQVQHLGQLGTSANAYTGVGQAALKIFREEGVLAFWKGNMLNVIRVFPYSAAQFASHEQYKQLLASPSGQLSLPQRLAAGAMAGMTATALTHPLDTVRLRLAMPVSGHTGLVDAFSTIIAKEGFGALYKGLFPTLLGIAPYAALNFASYDLIKSKLYSSGKVKESVPANLLVGATAGTIATTVCYPLDTVRRRMQMKGKVYDSTMHAFTTMLKTEGVKGFYRGWLANTLKVVPQNSIRFVTYEFCKRMLGVAKTNTDT